MVGKIWGAALIVIVSVSAWMAAGQGVGAESSSVNYRALVSRPLLALLHTPEVHAELKLTVQQVADLEELFAKIDPTWLPSRNQPKDRQLQVFDELEGQVQQWLDGHVSAEQRKRLRQIELQAQGSRMLLRPDVSAALKLTSVQLQQLGDLATATDAAQMAVHQAMQKNEDLAEPQKNFSAAAQKEQSAIDEVLTDPQRQQLAKALGSRFDTSKLRRTYPMAPEFVKAEHWINSEPLTLAGLRGKVVLVHFYAFQCHNCQANFEIYRRWHEEMTKKGVVVIGIQTPELESERSLEAVKAAAAERKLQFPILMDEETANWNAWGTTMWPTVYVVDRNGYIRQWWQGELQWNGATGDQTIEKVVDMALAEPYTSK
ncbi:MAG: redoxin domain-containing protein [Pirellulales bacterium]